MSKTDDCYSPVFTELHYAYRSAPCSTTYTRIILRGGLSLFYTLPRLRHGFQNAPLKRRPQQTSRGPDTRGEEKSILQLLKPNEQITAGSLLGTPPSLVLAHFPKKVERAHPCLDASFDDVRA